MVIENSILDIPCTIFFFFFEKVTEHASSLIFTWVIEADDLFSSDRVPKIIAVCYPFSCKLFLF